MAVTGLDKVFVVNAETNTKYGGVDPTGEFVTINDLVPQPYKVYTALLTQDGSSEEEVINIGPVEIGTTYLVGTPKPHTPWDFTNVGGPKYPDDYTFVATSSDIPNSYGNASLSFNWGAPVVTVLENTIGNITWSYQETGYYTGDLADGFIGNLFFQNAKVVFFSNDTETGQIAINIYKNDDSQIGVDTFKINGTYVDSVLNKTPIEIRVYNY